MNVEQLFNKRVKQFSRHKRTAYLPVLKKNENTFTGNQNLEDFHI